MPSCRCINIGATVAYLFLTNVALYGLGDLVPPRFGFFASFAIPLGAFVLALTAFLLGKRSYVLRPPEGSAVAMQLEVVADAKAREGASESKVATALAAKKFAKKAKKTRKSKKGAKKKS